MGKSVVSKVKMPTMVESYLKVLEKEQVTSRLVTDEHIVPIFWQIEKRGVCDATDYVMPRISGAWAPAHLWLLL